MALWLWSFEFLRNIKEFASGPVFLFLSRREGCWCSWLHPWGKPGSVSTFDPCYLCWHSGLIFCYFVCLWFFFFFLRFYSSWLSSLSVAHTQDNHSSLSLVSISHVWVWKRWVVMRCPFASDLREGGGGPVRYFSSPWGGGCRGVCVKVLDTAPSFCNILSTTGQGVPREGEEKMYLESWVVFCKTSSFMTMEEGHKKGDVAGL